MKYPQDWVFNNSLYALGDAFYRPVQPQGLQEPSVLHCNPHALALLDLPTDSCQDPDFIAICSGNQLLPGMQALAQDYAGHQFGRFNPLLGDGRVAMLGEIASSTGHWELSLKGAGRTPFARDADGLAGVTECTHEFHISQQLEALDVPVMHSVAVIQGKQQVYRNHCFEPTAILSRIAPTHIRFGTFELHYFQRNWAALQQLCDYVVARHYPECADFDMPEKQRHACFFRQVVLRTARLVAHWQAVGFVHGMMNTDNQSIIGITLDLGAAAFAPDFDPNYVASPVDEKGRYAFANQPTMGLWNCNVLARALSPLIGPDALKQALSAYEPEYLRWYGHFKAVHTESG